MCVSLQPAVTVGGTSFLFPQLIVSFTDLNCVIHKAKQQNAPERRQEMASERVILYGVGRRCRRFLREYPGCENSVLFAVDKDAGDEGISSFSFAVYKPEVLNSGKYYDIPVVITVADPQTVHDIQKVLVNYGVSENRIITPKAWIADCLENGTVYLKPKAVRLDICSLCQLNCRDCYMRISPAQTIGSGLVTVSQFCTFLDENPFIRRVELSNSGEPFIHPHLHEILAEAEKRNIEITIDNGTNFNYVTDEVLSSLVNGTVKKIRVSIDGASQDVYSVYRRNGNFEQVITNIRRLNALKRKYGTVYPQLIWQYVLMKHNLCDIEKAEELAKELGMIMEFKESWNVKEASAVREILQEKAAEGNGGNHLPKQQNNVHISDNSVFYCEMLIHSPQINWDGRLLGCCNVYRSDWGLNVFENGFLNCINSPIYLKTCASLLRNGNPLPNTPCEKCTLWNPKTKRLDI